MDYQLVNGRDGTRVLGLASRYRAFLSTQRSSPHSDMVFVFLPKGKGSPVATIGHLAGVSLLAT